GQDAETVLGLSVTPDFFATLGVRPLLGRTLSDQDATGPPVVVLSYGFWERHFGTSDRVIGTPIVMSGVPYQILGVMPRTFEFRLLDMRFDFWTPFAQRDAGYQPHGIGPLTIIARLRPGVTIAAAQSEAVAMTRQIESDYQPNFNGFLASVAGLQADNTR